MIYLYKSSEDNLVSLNQLNNKTKKRQTSLPKFDSNYYGSGYGEAKPVNYSVVRDYKYRSQTHSACLDFKLNNIFLKGYDFLNKDSFLEKFKMEANKEGDTFYDVISKFGIDIVELGMSYLEVVGNDFNNTMSIYPVDPDFVTAIPNREGNKIVAYKYYKSGKTYRISATKEDGLYRFLFPIMYPNNKSQIYGVPDWYSAMDVIDSHYAIDTWLDSFIDNNARFDFLIVTMGGGLSKSDKNKLKSQLSNNKGVENKGKSGYLSLDYDTKVKVIELNKVDHSNFINLKDKYDMQIVRSHGILGQNVNVTSGSGSSIAGNEAIGALRSDAETYVHPKQQLIEDRINKLFLICRGVNPQFKLKKMDVVSDKEKATIADMFINNKTAPPSYYERTLFPDLSDEEKKEIRAIRENSEQEDNKTTNRMEKPDSFDDTQNYERADRR